MISPPRQIELRYRRSHQTLTLILQLAEFPYLPDTHISITNDVAGTVIRDSRIGIRETGLLNIARGLHADANGLT
jgi:hypothetical protein